VTIAALLLAVNLTVLCAGAVSGVVHELGARYTQATGNAVTIVVGTAGEVRAHLDRGERVDAVMLPAGGIDDLARGGRVLVQTRADLGRTVLGVGVRSGAPLPDIASPEAFKQMLLAARAIASTDPGAGASFGIAFANVLKRLGIADAVAPKLKLTDGGRSCEIVARGEADVCVQSTVEIVPVAGVRVVGPVPDPLRFALTYTAAVPANAPNPSAGKAFVDYLTSPGQAEEWRKAGFEGASP
jgi:molybdate transport system substrate-binding protein